MSHLTTLINRVEKSIVLGHEDEADFPERIQNLKEYIENWDDYTERELIEAYTLFKVYAGYLPDDVEPHIELEGDPDHKRKYHMDIIDFEVERE